MPEDRILALARGVQLLVLDVDGVLTDGKIYFDQNGNEMKSFCTRDGLGMKALQHFGIPLAIITGRESNIVSERAKQLGIDFVYQGRSDKDSALMELVESSSIGPEAMCYAGDDWIDLPVLRKVGFSVAPADAAPLIRQRVHWVTPSAGGQGAVREICDLIIAAKGFEGQIETMVHRQ